MRIPKTKTKTVTDATLEKVQKRFFDAFGMLMGSGKIKSLSGFCEEHGFHRPKYSNIRTGLQNPDKGSEYKTVDITALSIIVDRYDVNAEWLLTGKGGMFKKTDSIQDIKDFINKLNFN